jgi:beta-glucosidase
MVKYASIPYSVVNSPEHQALALQAARKTVVLLKNDNNALPLQKNLKTIAVIGPNADDQEVLWGNYNGIPAATVTPLHGIKAKLPNANILYARGCEFAETGEVDSATIKKNFDDALAKVQQADVTIMFMGLSPRLEGEEMKVKAKGFNGGDRETLDLPKPQKDMIKAIKATGKPVVLVLLNCPALSINWENDNLPAIVDAWYGGQAGGTAIADVLFGDYNPAGRLPVTFYKSVNDLPSFDDYSMSNRTYRYFNGPVLYPFGYGLSYTNFTYTHIKFPGNIATGKAYTISAQITNTGKTDGEEVAELYVKHFAEVRKPIIALKGFQRISLKAGETKTVTFTLNPQSLSLFNEAGNQVERSEKIQLFIAGAQPPHDGNPQKNIISKMTMIQGNDYRGN